MFALLEVVERLDTSDFNKEQLLEDILTLSWQFLMLINVCRKEMKIQTIQDKSQKSRAVTELHGGDEDLKSKYAVIGRKLYNIHT